MAPEVLDVFGFYLPSLMLWAPLALLASILLCWLLRRAGVYRFVWHRALFDMAVYVIVLGGIVYAWEAGWLR